MYLIKVQKFVFLVRPQEKKKICSSTYTVIQLHFCFDSILYIGDLKILGPKFFYSLYNE